MKPCFVVFADLSPQAEQLALYAAGFGAPLGARLHLLHLYYSSATEPELVLAATAVFQRSQAEAAHLLRQLADQLPGPVAVTVSTQPVREALAEAARHCYPALLVLGLSDERQLLDYLLRNQLLPALRTTHRPLLLVPVGAAGGPAPRRVVIAVDGESFTLNAAAQRLAPLLRSWPATWTVVHAQMSGEQQAFRGQRALGTVRQSNLLARQTPLALYEVNQQLPADAILQALHDSHAELLVLIVRPRSFLDGLFHRSVTARVLRSCPVPVLLLPAEAPEMPGWLPTTS